MNPDAHTACPACPEIVRLMYDTAAALVLALEERVDPSLEQCERLSPAELSALATLHATLMLLRPWVDAHRANQLHAFSPELDAARWPRVHSDAIVTLAGDTPFTSAREHARKLGERFGIKPAP